MMNILYRIENARLEGKQVGGSWYCDPENDRAVETAEEFCEEVTLPFHIKPIPKVR